MEIKKEDALRYHEKLRGKIEINPKMSISDKEELSLVYTPGVAFAASEIARDPKRALTLTNKGNTVAIITDGTAVLGLGDIGCEAALPVMEGKAVLFKEMGGVDAYPIVLNEKDPKKIIEIIKAISPTFSGINLEDIAAPNCFEIENALKKELSIPVFHDDQHGAAIVVLAGLINALKLTGRGKDAVVVINGAGAAGIATANLLLEYGIKNIKVLDKYGALFIGQEEMNSYQARLADRLLLKTGGSLQEAIKDADIFIGLSKGGLLSLENASLMARDAIIFALANPFPEIMPQEAKKSGASVVATGRSDYPNQINNALVFPGLFRGLLDMKKPSLITYSDMIRVAEALAALVKSPSSANIIPSIFDKNVARAVAAAIKNE